MSYFQAILNTIADQSKASAGCSLAASFPNIHTVAVWSLELNIKGNSMSGMQSLARLTTATGHPIF